MKKTTVLFILFTLLIVSSIYAETEQDNNPIKKHQVGVRLGTWDNTGAIHTVPPLDSLTTLVLSLNDVSFYIEGFYAYNIFASFFTEISLGVVNRGDMQLYNDDIYDFSNILLYPLTLQLKFFPLYKSNSTFQPFIGAGGGFFFAKQDIQFTNDYLAQYYQQNGDTQTDFNYTITGGFDWQVRDNFSLELQGKHMPIQFSKFFIGEKDYSGTTISIGFKYKYNTKKR